MPKEQTKVWSVQKAIVDRVNLEADKEWSKSPNLVSPKVTLGPIHKNSPAWYVLITNMQRLANELKP